MREVAKVKEERFDWLYIEGNRLPVPLALFRIRVLLRARINSTPGLWATRSSTKEHYETTTSARPIRVSVESSPSVRSHNLMSGGKPK